MICSICGKEITDKFGNNPYPVRTNENDRCCNRCNSRFVIPARLIQNNSNMDLTALNYFSYDVLESVF